MQILIVDDEPRHRRGMAGMIHSMRPDYHVLTAKDGTEALEAVRSYQPEIVLSDIRMPQMDGLTFLKLLDETGHKPRVVMLSAYDLFEYAQTAIRHGAYDYLLKPVEAEKVEDLLRRIEDQLAAEDAQRLRQQLTSSVYVNRLLQSWLLGGLSAEELEELAAFDFIKGAGTIVFTAFRISRGNSQSFDAEAMMRQLKQVWACFGEAHLFAVTSMQEGLFQAVTIVRGHEWTETKRDGIRAALTPLGEEWNECGRLTHGIGPYCWSLAETAPEACRAAQSAVHYAFHECWNGVLFHDELRPARKRKVLALEGERLFEALQDKDVSAAIALCRSSFDELADDGHTDPVLIKEYASLVLMKIKSRSRGAVERQIGSQLTDSAVSGIPACNTYEQLLNLLEARLRDVHQALSHVKQEKSEIIIENCMQWVQEKYMEDLTLDKAAELFFFNASYFSTLFKSRTGRSFSEYVTDVRMNRAKELLAAGSLRIYEIASQCGYRDTKYFCRIFKKQNGFSPATYKHIVLPQSGREDGA